MIFDYLIIGGGVVGSAVLNKLTRLNQKCLLIEKELDVSTGASKANSGIVHAGFDAEPNTLKAELNVRGNFLYRQLCKELSVPLKECGALVVANEKMPLEELKNRGIKNGVDKLEIIEKEELNKLVPNISQEMNYALQAKTSCIVSPYMFTIALAEESVLNGAEIKLGENILKISKKNNIFEIVTEKNTYFTKNIINCAGAGFNEVSKMIGTETYDIKYRRGEYYLLDKSTSGFVNLTVFPLPTKKGKGTILSPTIDGNILIGPSSYDSDTSTKTTEEGLDYVFYEAKKIFNNIPMNKIIRVYSGIRTIVGNDFVIEKSKLVDGVINVAGICSPGLTSAPAIAEKIALDFLKLEDNEKEMIKRRPILKFANLTQKERDKLINQNPDYGKVVCRCECVTLAEIKEAILSPLRPTTVDAIKRRTRAGMGRCQGGYCLSQVIEEIAKENNLKITDIKKESKNSNIICGDIRE